MKQRVVDYNWDGSNSINRNKPTTKQFGIIAQNAGEFSIVNEQTGYLSVSSLDLINIGIKTDQEIIKKIQDHEKEISALETTMNFDIWQLKNEIKELKNEINSLRQAVA